MLPSFAYTRPTTLDDATKKLASRGARVHAGGTDLIGCLHDGVFGADTVVSLSAVPDLVGIRETPDGGLRIGAMTTIAEVANHPRVRTRARALADAAAVVASPQLRTQGTLGGNLCQKPRCWYYRGDFHCLRKGGETCFAFDGENQFHCIFGGDACYIVHPSDTAPALIALGALVRITGPGTSRVLEVEKLHVPPGEDPRREVRLEPGEVITEVSVPAPAAGLRSSYRKVRTRASWDFALAGVALALEMDARTVRSARVVLSGVAPVPWRVTAVERVVTGSTLDADTIRRASEAAVEGAQPLARNGFKVALVRGLITDELERVVTAA
jgi:xanthine dehydrogenase YagS FAD-binding subunit